MIKGDDLYLSKSSLKGDPKEVALICFVLVLFSHRQNSPFFLTMKMITPCQSFMYSNYQVHRELGHKGISSELDENCPILANKTDKSRPFSIHHCNCVLIVSLKGCAFVAQWGRIRLKRTMKTTRRSSNTS